MRQPTAFNILMDSYIRLTSPYKPGDPDPAQRAAVKAMYARFGRSCRLLLDLALGDPDKALAGIKAIASRMEKNGLSWKLETVVEHFPEYFCNPEAYNGETKHQRR